MRQWEITASKCEDKSECLTQVLIFTFTYMNTFAVMLRVCVIELIREIYVVKIVVVRALNCYKLNCL